MSLTTLFGPRWRLLLIGAGQLSQAVAQMAQTLDFEVLARKLRLAEHFGLNETTLARLHGPVGLHLGAKTPAEIAISIVAEIVQVKNTALQSTGEAVAWHTLDLAGSRSTACAVR